MAPLIGIECCCRVQSGESVCVAARDDGLEMHTAAKSGQEVISSVFVRRVGERYRRAMHARLDLLFNYLFISLQFH